MKPEQKGWWYRATKEQRLAQIDAGLDLGMTAGQVAMNCGCLHDRTTNPGSAVSNYASRHGGHFPHESETRMRKRLRNSGVAFSEGKIVPRRRARLNDVKEQYLSGDPVDMWSVE